MFIGQRQAASSRRQAVLRVGQYGDHLIARNAREPFQKVIHTGALFKILKQCTHGDARAPEHPGAADAIRYPFNRGAHAPIQHGASLDPFNTTDKRASETKPSRVSSASDSLFDGAKRPTGTRFARHLIPRPALELAAGPALEDTAPLLEEERHACSPALIPNVAHP